MQESVNYIILAKISSLKYLKDIQNGKLYMNNLKFYVDLEKNSGKQGIGDILEASLINIKKHKLFIEFDGEVKREIPISPAPGIIYDNKALYHPVFCMMIKHVDLRNIAENQWEGRFQILKEEIEDFTDQVEDVGALVICDVQEFLNRIKLATKKMNIDVRVGPVKYRDKRIPEVRNNGLVLDDTFIKDLRFKKQSEFRIELLVHQDKHMILDIGNIHDISYIVKGDKITDGMTIKFQMYPE